MRGELHRRPKHHWVEKHYPRLTTSCTILALVVCALVTEEMVASISDSTRQVDVPEHACSVGEYIEMFALLHNVLRLIYIIMTFIYTDVYRESFSDKYSLIKASYTLYNLQSAGLAVCSTACPSQQYPAHCYTLPPLQRHSHCSD